MITAGIACRPLARRRVRGTGRKYCAARSRVNGGVLAGVLIGTHHAAAQAQEACPLPAGATAVEPPDVTAPQVENAPNLLRDFAFYIGCLVRQDDSPWRAGSTYIVTLTLDGRVFLHAKDDCRAGGVQRDRPGHGKRACSPSPWGTEGRAHALSDAGSRRLSLGGRYDIGPWVGMSLEGAHGRPAQGAAAHSVMLRADLRW